MKKIIYAIFILLALVVFTFTMVLADVECPPTDTPQPPPSTETPLPPSTETSEPTPTSPPEDEPTPTSPPPETETQMPPTETVEVPFSEPTPTIEVDPTPTPERTNGKPSPTPDCVKDYENNKDKCLAPTGGGLPPNVALGLIAISGVVCVFLILLARAGRRVER